MKKINKLITLIIAIMALTTFPQIVFAAGYDTQPEPNVVIDYNVLDELPNILEWDALQDGTYYVIADAKSFDIFDIGGTAPTDQASWKVEKDDDGFSVTKLILTPQDYVSFAEPNLYTFDVGASDAEITGIDGTSCSIEISVNVDYYEKDLSIILETDASSKYVHLGGSIWADVTTDDYASTYAYNYEDSYWIYNLLSKQWEKAEVAMIYSSSQDNKFYLHFTDSRSFGEIGFTALYAAKNSSDPYPEMIMLLEDIVIDNEQTFNFTSSMPTGMPVLMCADDIKITVTTGGNLDLSTLIIDEDSNLHPINLEDGGKITYHIANLIYAKYSDDYNGESSSVVACEYCMDQLGISAFSAGIGLFSSAPKLFTPPTAALFTSTIVNEDLLDRPVSVSGVFASLDGHFEAGALIDVNDGAPTIVDTDNTVLKVTNSDVMVVNDLSMQTLKLNEGSVEIDDSLVVYGTISVGSTAVATFNTDGAAIMGTLAVTGDVITSFPVAIPTNNKVEFGGWTVNGSSADISQSSYTIQNGDNVEVKWVELVEESPKTSSSYSFNKKNAPLTSTELNGNITIISKVPNTYSFSGNTANVGDITLQSTKYIKGQKIYFSVNPSTSFGVESVNVIDENRLNIPVTYENGLYSFIAPDSKVTITASFFPYVSANAGTSDVKSSLLSSQSIYLNGKLLKIECYNVNGYNYFKLRDIAYILNSTANKFSVVFDGSQNIYINTGIAYSPVGTELMMGTDMSKTTVKSAWGIVANDAMRYFSTYNIGGFNYLQLRELSLVTGFNVSFDAKSNSVHIETSDYKTK